MRPPSCQMLWSCWWRDMDAVVVLEILRREMSLRLRAAVRDDIHEAMRTVATIIVMGAALLVCACIGVLLR